MIKYSASFLKTLIGAMPLGMKNALRKSSILLAWYTLVVNKSGYKRTVGYRYFNNLQPDGADPLYLENIKEQEVSINDSAIISVSDAIALILPTDYSLDALFTSVESVLNSSIPYSKVCIVGEWKECEVKEKLLNKLDSENPNLFWGETVVSLMGNIEDDCPTVLLYEGDVIHADYLFATSSNLESDTDIAYVDTDLLNERSQRCLPHFYPDWDPDFQLTTAYVQSGVWLRSVGLLSNYPNFLSRAYIAEFLCRAIVEKKELNIAHVPLVLLHRPIVTQCIFDYMSATYWQKLSEKAQPNFRTPGKVLSLKWHAKKQPLVSLIIPTKNGKDLVKACIESILNKTSYADYEILLVDNNSDEVESLEYFSQLDQHPKITLLKYPKPFNYSAINNFAASHANGEVIGLINNDIEVISPDWLDHMVGHVVRPDIGCVGAKLLFANGQVQHAGVVMGYGGGAGHAHKYFPRHNEGYMNRLVATHGFSAVTAACLLVTKEDFDAVKGLNEVDLTVAFNDVDFCLRILELGRRNLFCAEAELYHHESISRGAEDTIEKQKRFAKEVGYLQTTWASYIEADPAYNPNLTLTYENFSIKRIK